MPDTIAIGAARISGHGVATTSTASARTGSPLSAHAAAGDRERERQEPGRVAIRHPHERRPLGLRVAHQPDERRVRAVGGAVRRPQLERRAGVGAAAARRRPAARVTGSDSPVSADSSSTASSPATTPSTGTTSPGRTTTTSPGRSTSTETSSRSRPRARCAMRGARSSSAVSSRRARRPAASSSALPPGQHQRDDRAGQLLAERRARRPSRAAR